MALRTMAFAAVMTAFLPCVALAADPDGRAQSPQPPEPCALETCEPGDQSPVSEAVAHWRLQPYVVIVGGAEGEMVVQPEEGTLENRITTLALSRFGFRGEVAGGIYVESEFEANAGAHGASVWEGQAAMQVRNQLIRVSHGRWMGEVGRITDIASLNFVSAHALDQLGMDSYIRTSLLYSGFNRGNGVRGTVEVAEGLKLGLTANAANPTSMTGAIMIGGTFFPFSRFYTAPYAYIASSPNTMPQDTYHTYILSPSAMVETDVIKLHAAYQRFQANTNTGLTEDPRINGFNARLSAMVLLADVARLFASGAFTQNDVIDATDGLKLSDDIYTSVFTGAGVDVILPGGFGIGGQYDRIRDRQGEGSTRISQFVNVGGTYWLNPVTSMTLRGALYRFTEDSETFVGPRGERSAFLTMRVAL